MGRRTILLIAALVVAAVGTTLVFLYVHGLQDANADVTRINNGLTSRKRVAAERGEDIREIDEENAEDEARAEALGLDYGDAAKQAAADQTVNDAQGDTAAAGQ